MLFYSFFVILLGPREVTGFIRLFPFLEGFPGRFRDNVVSLEYHARLRLPDAELPLGQRKPDKYIADPEPLVYLFFSGVVTLGARSQAIRSLGQRVEDESPVRIYRPFGNQGPLLILQPDNGSTGRRKPILGLNTSGNFESISVRKPIACCENQTEEANEKTLFGHKEPRLIRLKHKRPRPRSFSPPFSRK